MKKLKKEKGTLLHLLASQSSLRIQWFLLDQGPLLKFQFIDYKTKLIIRSCYDASAVTGRHIREVDLE